MSPVTKALALITFLFIAFPPAAAAQSSLARRQSVQVARGETIGPDEDVRQDTTEASFFGSGALGFWPSKSAGFDIETAAIALKVFGRPTRIEDGDSIRFEETIAFELYIDSYIVDAASDLPQAIKDYVISKKGSPVSLRYPFGYWSSREGDVRQFWAAGQAYGSVRAIPLGESGFDRMAGSASIGYTQAINIDFAAQGEPGNIFMELTGNGNVPFGSGIRSSLFGADSDGRYVFGLDYRIGVSLGGTRVMGVTGTYSFADIAGSQNTVRFTFGAGSK